MRRFAIGLSALLLGAWSAAAPAQVMLYINTHGHPGPEQFIYDTGGTFEVQVVLDGIRPMEGVWFALKLPECEGLWFNNASYGGDLHMGSLETGVYVFWAGCFTNFPCVVATLTFYSTGIDTCCFLEFVPDSVRGTAWGTDCNYEKIPVYTINSALAPAGSGYACGAPPPPTNPSPPDGAVNQPLSTALSWDQELPPLGCGLCTCATTLLWGADPDHMQGTWDVGPPFAIGPLQPSTTYYWKVYREGLCSSVTEGPLWSFTTEEGVAAETSTWGRIKALYR